ncbi:MAG: hypothetical protein ACTSQO_02020 [Candidatus Helarchaeota archaeon]
MYEKFLKFFIKFCGIIEVVIGISLIFITPVFEMLNLNTIPLSNQLAGVGLALLGFLLFYSARDLNKYQIILIASLLLRYIMPIFEIYAAITINSLMVMLIGASIYDLVSANLTLFLLKSNGYLSFKSNN